MVRALDFDIATSRRDAVVLEARQVAKTFRQPDGQGVLNVLDNVSLAIHEGEVVALLGRSGSGKSTLLRILAGLLPPSAGEVLDEGAPLHGPNPHVAMVFQSFALLPWLTVLQNVELGLEARGIARPECRTRALRAIDLIGLDGFEEAFPKELSGGMKQRVGFARALVTEPRVLLMDEPFSALDVLTGATLRLQLEELWRSGEIPTRALLIVTHNIEEAVEMADRIVVFGSNPGRVRIEVPGLPPALRERKGPERTRLVDTLYRIMMNPDADAASLVEPGRRERRARPARYQVLPDVGVDELTGFVQYLAGIGGRVGLHELTRDLQMRADDLLAVIEAADLMGFAELEERTVFLTEAGERLAEAELDEEKAIFRERALAQVALLHHIVRELEAAPDHTTDAQRVVDHLEGAFGVEEALRQFETAVDWGRYGELFTYDGQTGVLRLDEEHRVTLAEDGAEGGVA